MLTNTKPKSNRLAPIARAIKAQAATAPGGKVYRRLDAGIHIVYAGGERCRLAIGRVAPAAPAAPEVALIAAAFDVPDGSEPATRQVRWRNPVTEYMTTFNVVEITWREVNP